MISSPTLVSRLRATMLPVLVVALFGLSLGCPDPEPVDPCPGGICPEGDANRGMDSGTPVDAFSPDVPGLDAPGLDAMAFDTPVVTPDDTGGPTCIESWVCEPWTTGGSSDAATRTCTDRNACGTTTTRPALTATLPALDFEFYECNVEPILDRGCGQLGCHGAESGRALRVYARGRHRIIGETFIEPGCLSAGSMHPSEACEGSVECRCWTLPHSASEWRRNYDAARGFALDATGAPLGDMATSELLTQPLLGGGLAHAGIKFWRPGDPDHQAILAWLQGNTLGRTCNSRN